MTHCNSSTLTRSQLDVLRCYVPTLGRHSKALMERAACSLWAFSPENHQEKLKRVKALLTVTSPVWILICVLSSGWNAQNHLPVFLILMNTDITQCDSCPPEKRAWHSTNTLMHRYPPAGNRQSLKTHTNPLFVSRRRWQKPRFCPVLDHGWPERSVQY